MKKQLKELFKWSLSFTKRVIVTVTILWIIQLIYSMIMIWYAVDTQGNFSYLDSFIADNGETFRLIVGTNIISTTVENIYKYNEGGIFGKSITSDINQHEEEESL